MERNELKKGLLFRSGDRIIRVLGISEEDVFYIDCIRRTMPVWGKRKLFDEFTTCSVEELSRVTDIQIPDYSNLSSEGQRTVHERYTLIAGIVPFASIKQDRNRVIESVAREYGVSKQKIRYYLCLYLAYQDVAVLAPKERDSAKELTADEKNMRWALNRFYFTRNRNSLSEAYTQMIKSRYTDEEGNILEGHSSPDQFRYFFRRYRKLQTQYIARDGIKSYERDHRPLLGDGIQEYAPYVGMAMLDATVCDIYLVDEAGGIVGRPILTAAVDAFSSFCLGYSLQWEGGMYSVRTLLTCMLSDKAAWCRERGVAIDEDVWNCDRMPGVFITDAGAEFRSENFEQLAELGVTVVNLQSYRPDLKGPVEKMFDLIQESYEPYLQGKGFVEPDFQQRGVHDYRKDACLTMSEFERIVIHCIVYYNCWRVIENHPFTDEMLAEGVQPYARDIFAWGCRQISANFIDVDLQKVLLTLLPRAEGRFSRRGLKVNGMRYKADGFTEEFLRGGPAVVAYNPDDVSQAWLLRNGEYIPFDLIESRYRNKSLEAVNTMMKKKKDLVKAAEADNLQAKVDLARHIETIAGLAGRDSAASIKDIRKNRDRERRRTHTDVMKGGKEDV